jgi:hypothetical protein
VARGHAFVLYTLVKRVALNGWGKCHKRIQGPRNDRVRLPPSFSARHRGVDEDRAVQRGALFLVKGGPTSMVKYTGKMMIFFGLAWP